MERDFLEKETTPSFPEKICLRLWLQEWKGHKRTMKVKHIVERVMNAVFFLCGIVSIAAVLLITLYMIIAGLPAIKEIGLFDFLFGTVWQSTAADPKFGILPFIMTSIWGTIGAVIIGVPIGLFTAIFLAKMAPPKVAAVVHPAVELLAGIPSVVYGLIGMMVLVPAIMNIFDLKSGSSSAGRHPGIGSHDSAGYHFCE